jgi:hypothetical protein
MQVSFNIHMLTFLFFSFIVIGYSHPPASSFMPSEVTVFVVGSDYNPGSHSFMR